MNRTFYKLNIQGIVYLVDPATAIAYTYDTSNPVEIGSVIWNDAKLGPAIDLYHDWKTIMNTKMEQVKNDPPDAEQQQQ
jgi:hypothetical protein